MCTNYDKVPLSVRLTFRNRIFIETSETFTKIFSLDTCFLLENYTPMKMLL